MYVFVVPAGHVFCDRSGSFLTTVTTKTQVLEFTELASALQDPLTLSKSRACLISTQHSGVSSLLSALGQHDT